MKRFSDFGITAELNTFVGDKIPIDRVFNREITVIDFRVGPSKFEKGSGKCLDIQIELDGIKRVVFTGSLILIQMIEKAPDFPFITTIIKETGGGYQFT